MSHSAAAANDGANADTHHQLKDKNEQSWNRIVDALLKHALIGSNIKTLLTDYVEIEYDEAKKLQGYQSAAHAFFWAPNPNKLWDFDLRASILMQMRFDGSLGFPGGFIDGTDPTWEFGLNRELDEELNLASKFHVTREQHYRTWVSHERKMILNFYVRQVNLAEYDEIERDGRESHDYGGEVMGLVRPPLFLTSRQRGFCVFIQNQFIGNSLIQLLKCLHDLQIMSASEIVAAIEMTPI